MRSLKLIKATLLAGAIIAMTGCGNTNDENAKMEQQMQQVRKDLDMRTRQHRDNRFMTREEANGQQGRNGARQDEFKPFGDNSFSDYYNNGNGDHRNTTVDISDEIAQQIAKMDGVDSANVLITDRNAYVAVELDDEAKLDTNTANNKNDQTATTGKRRIADQDEMPADMKQQIAKQVQQAHPSINNVYVSANPDFADRFKGFMEHINRGDMMEGFMQEFNTLMNRIFPHNAAEDEQEVNLNDRMNVTNLNNQSKRMDRNR